MRGGEFKPISEVLKQYLKNVKNNNFLEFRLMKIWKETLGENFVKYTKKISFHKGILFVYLNSSVARNELSMFKEQLIKELNKKIGKEYIKNIIFK